MESGPPDFTSEILKNCISIEYDLDDAFCMNFIDSDSIAIEDFRAFQSSYLYAKYGPILIIAYCSLKNKLEPIEPYLITDFYLAKIDIVKNLKQFPDLHLELRGKYP